MEVFLIIFGGWACYAWGHRSGMKEGRETKELESAWEIARSQLERLRDERKETVRQVFPNLYPVEEETEDDS